MPKKPSRDILKGWDILLLDDDINSLDIAQLLLQHYGATVHIAKNGKEGLALLEKMTPRFIISDLSMPEMDGWEFIQVVKLEDRWRDIPAIALTAHAMFGDKERAIAVGFHNYLTKPLSPSTFIHDLLVLLIDIPELEINYSPQD